MSKYTTRMSIHGIPEKRSRQRQIKRGQAAVVRVVQELSKLGLFTMIGNGNHGEPDLFFGKNNRHELPHYHALGFKGPDLYLDYVAEVKTIHAFRLRDKDGKTRVEAQNVKLNNTSWKALTTNYEEYNVFLIIEIRAGTTRFGYKWFPAGDYPPTRRQYQAIPFWDVMFNGRNLSELRRCIG